MGFLEKEDGNICVGWGFFWRMKGFSYEIGMLA